MTATVDPAGMAFTSRASPLQRLDDYGKALKKWCGNSPVDPIIFCENSGYDIAELNRHCGGPASVQLLSFCGNEYPRHLGKGFGEMNILRYALDTCAIPDEDLVVKVTGRYYVPNAGALISYMRRYPDCEAFCRLDPPATFAHSGFFAATAGFLRTYLLCRQGRINDSAGVFFEHILAEALQQAALDGVAWRRFPHAPRIEGISATWNVRYNP